MLALSRVLRIVRVLCNAERMSPELSTEAVPSYLVDHGAAIEEIGQLATLLADILSAGPLRGVALRIAAEQPSVMRARALLGCSCGFDSYDGCPCGL